MYNVNPRNLFQVYKKKQNNKKTTNSGGKKVNHFNSTVPFLKITLIFDQGTAAFIP